MQSHYLLPVLTLLILIGLVSQATAETRKLKCTVSGSFTDGVETNIDTNGDGASANLGQGVVRCNGGSSGVFQEEVEWIEQLSLTNCPNTSGMVEFHISSTEGQHRSVTTDLRTGDQLFGQVTSGTLCFDGSTGVLTITNAGQILGGTGKNAGATGSFTFQGSSTYLAFGFKNGVFGGFGQFSGAQQVTLIRP